MEVTLCGTPDEESGYVMDLKKLKAILLECIIKKVDHSFLNELDIFKDTIPTTENMTRVFWDILKDKINKDNVKLYSIKLYETEKNSVEYRGE
jgi:6-pyruvoyltetrahydropterin/6-carboxytetrahydropterin synthase